jgi:hypothetical protein
MAAALNAKEDAIKVTICDLAIEVANGLQRCKELAIAECNKLYGDK